MSSYPMVDEVNRLVGNLLAGGSEVCLPGVGTLGTVRRPAQRLSRRKVVPPGREVTFSSQELGVALPLAIASAARCGTEEARAIYERWLERTYADQVLTIEGIGVLRFKHFTPDPAFEARLNPAGRQPVRIRSARRFDWAMWVGSAAIVIALFFGGREFLMLYPDEELLSGTELLAENGSEELPDALAVAEPVVPEGVGAGATAAGMKDPAVAGNENSAALPSGAESPANVADAQSSTTLAETQSAATVSGTQSVSNVSGEQSAATGSGTAAATASGGAASVRTAGPSAPSEAPAALTSGRYYVVLGVFSTPENAARAVSQAAKRVSDTDYGIYRFGSKFMVSAFEAADAAACAEFIRRYRDTFPDLWTYRAR
ncbi:SPOR domain-containing protein [Alistipes sp.]|uniref:SPOR domain-containing protein n=1 Tax=Alistipes sp. TaxID=1872444 RepID=UPI003AF04EB3